MSALRILGLITVGILLTACSDNSAPPPLQSSSAPLIKGEGEIIPRSMSEQANYYLISTEADGEYLRTVHSRISSTSHGYSVTRIDCLNRRYQDLGYGEDRLTDIKMYNNNQWAGLVSGSSKDDLVTFACYRVR